MYSTLRTNTRNIYISVSVRVHRCHTGADALQYTNISGNIFTPLRDDFKLEERKFGTGLIC